MKVIPIRSGIEVSFPMIEFSQCPTCLAFFGFSDHVECPACLKSYAYLPAVDEELRVFIS